MRRKRYLLGSTFRVGYAAPLTTMVSEKNSGTVDGTSKGPFGNASHRVVKPACVGTSSCSIEGASSPGGSRNPSYSHGYHRLPSCGGCGTTPGLAYPGSSPSGPCQKVLSWMMSGIPSR